jgi:hypothetical protein
MKPVSFKASFEIGFKKVVYVFSGPVYQQSNTHVKPLSELTPAK